MAEKQEQKRLKELEEQMRKEAEEKQLKEEIRKNEMLEVYHQLCALNVIAPTTD